MSGEIWTIPNGVDRAGERRSRAARCRPSGRRRRPALPTPIAGRTSATPTRDARSFTDAPTAGAAVLATALALAVRGGPPPPRSARSRPASGRARSRPSSRARAASTAATSTSPRSPRRTGSRASSSRPGARLVLRGGYPHGRYMSVNAYSRRRPTDALSDIDIAPDPGATNPFIAGNRRDGERRGWTMTRARRAGPADARAPNTIYARPQAGRADRAGIPRVRARRGHDLTGGTGLPEAELRAGRRDAADAATTPAPRSTTPTASITVQTVPAAALAGGDELPPGHPAFDPVRWERFFNLDYSTASVPADCTEAGFTGAPPGGAAAAGRALLQQGQRVHLHPPVARLRRARRAPGDAARVPRDEATASR